jgi:hypothetical protein
MLLKNFGNDQDLHGLKVWQISAKNLKIFSEFVFNIYSKDYWTRYQNTLSQDDLHQIIQEDQIFFVNSVFIAIKTISGKIVATVRLTHKTSNITLPIEKEFGIKTLELRTIEGTIPPEVWNCGRLAVNPDTLKENGLKVSPLKILKVLTDYIGKIAFWDMRNILVSESDERAFKLMQVLGFGMEALGEGKDYLGSLTIPTISYAYKYWRKYEQLQILLGRLAQEDRFLKTQDDIFVYQVCEQNLESFSRFVFGVYEKECYKMYRLRLTDEDLHYMIQEDKRLFKNSVFIVVKSIKGEMLATMRLTHKSDDSIVFPIEQQFDISTGKSSEISMI